VIDVESDLAPSFLDIEDRIAKWLQSNPSLILLITIHEFSLKFLKAKINESPEMRRIIALVTWSELEPWSKDEIPTAWTPDGPAEIFQRRDW